MSARAASASSNELQAAEQVTELLLLGAEIADVPRMRRHFDRHAFADGDAVRLQAFDLLRIVGDEANLRHLQIAQDLRRDAVIATVFLETQLEVRFDGVASLILQRVGTHLVRETDAAPFLM